MEVQVIEKIKKLLKMKTGGTAAEIENALYLAKKLADKYNIDLESINPEDEREPITHLAAMGKISRLQIEVKYAALIVQQFFNINAFASQDYYKKNIIFVGTEVDIEIAKYVFNYLIKQFRYEWNHNRGRLRNRQSFMEGMYEGICRKLYRVGRELKQTEGLILVDRSAERKDYLQKQFSDLKSEKVKPKNEAVAAKQRGLIAGVNTNIHKGLNSNQSPKALNA
jgi:hypothetical protein